jgi:predicted SprT family Zn-dependent metalloprotease
MRPLEKLVSIAALSVIVGGAVYAFERESLRNSDLHERYQRINREYFDAGLQDATVEWGSLTDATAKTYTYADGSARIVLDPQSNTSESDIRESLRHESCHVMTHVAVEASGEDAHGPTWQKCMQRFEAKK